MSAGGYRGSVLLAVRDQAELLLRCLSSVARLGDDAGFEAVVVDDGSVDATPQVLSGIEGDFQALREEGIGWGLAIDRAASVARGERLILLREDAIPVDGWFDALLSALDADGVGAVRAVAARLDGSVAGGSEWACLGVRREAFEAVGGFAGSSVPGRAEKASLLEAIEAAGFAVVDEPAAVVLLVPEGAGA